MQNQSFQDIMKLEIDVTNKLLTYMHSQIDIMNILDDLEIDFNIYSDRNNLALNIWLGVDYIDEEGKNFIEKLLNDKSVYLTKLEREVLQEKSSSFVSLFEILAFENNTVLLRDILNDNEYQVLEPSIHNVIEVGEFLFTRIGNILGNYIFMGDINYVPSLVKDIFLEELLVDYNLARNSYSNLSMVDYLKQFSLNLYRIYNESLIDVIENDGDINSFVFDELDEYESFLLNKYKDITVKKHLSNLSNIFEYALADNDMTLYDIDKLDLASFFDEAIQDGFISSQEEFNAYISTIKSYLQYLNIGDPEYKRSYTEILNISKNRFKLMSKLDTNNSFNLDRDLASLITFYLNDQAVSLIMDYDKFILFISDKNLKLTAKNKRIKRNDLLKINKILENSISIDKKAPNQDDFPLINLFFYASLNNDVFKIQGQELILTNKGLSLLRLADEEKYALLIQYISSKEFIEGILNYPSNNAMDMLRDNFMDFLSKLKVDKLYHIDELSFEGTVAFYNYYPYLLDLGLIRINNDFGTSISVTGLGKKVFSFIYQQRDTVEDKEVIKLDDFKKARNKMGG